MSKEVYREFDKLHDYYIGEISKYKQYLDEIEEIVKSKCVDCTIDDYSYCPECRYETIIDVRKKIKEIKG